MPENHKELGLYDYPYDQKINPEISDSPTFGHVQLLDKMADFNPIPEDLKSSVLEFATRDKEKLSQVIDEWKKTNELSRRFIS